MADNKKRRRSYSKKIIAVDVWMTQFSNMGVKGVMDVYDTKFNTKSRDLNKKKSFSYCLNALRKLEKPSYESPQDKNSY